LFYVVGHLLNHAFGLISLEAMEAGLRFSVDPWRTLPGTLLLGGAALAHTVTALWALYQRRSLRMPFWQAAQNLLGLLIPFVLVAHILGTRFLVELWQVDHSYTLEMAFLWVMVPSAGILQAVAVVVVWLHACVGIHYWLRLKPSYPKWQQLAFSVALLLPALSLAGFVSAGNRVLERVATDEAWLDRVAEAATVRPEMLGWVLGTTDALQLAAAGVIVALLALRAVRAMWVRRTRYPQLSYVDGRVFEILPGMTMLEVLRASRIPHPSVCGGRGRCSTCRVHVGTGAAMLPPPSAEEQRVLDRIEADKKVRLACQVRPTADVHVTPLLPAAASPAHGRRAAYRRSEERQVAILFADMRGFTRFSEDRLPYDVVFVLNRYRIAMSEAIEEAGGVVNEFVGDGIMALFGLESDAADGSRRALRCGSGSASTLGPSSSGRWGTST
jgi:adenylate cyclase